MTPAKRDERIPQTFAFRQFVYGQPTNFVCQEREAPKPRKKREDLSPIDRYWLSIVIPIKEAA